MGKYLKCRGDYVEKTVGQQYNEMWLVLVRSEKQWAQNILFL